MASSLDFFLLALCATDIESNLLFLYMISYILKVYFENTRQPPREFVFQNSLVDYI